jgi:hypothetical protein
MNKSMVLSAFMLLAPYSESYADEYVPISKPMYMSLPAHGAPERATSHAAKLPTWNTVYTYNGTKYSDAMLGANPAKSNVTTTIPVYIIPIKLVYGANNGNMVFDPAKHVLPNGNTVVGDLIASPLFSSGVDFIQDGTNLGATQYIDAFQRGNFWTAVRKNPNYHILLGDPKVLSEQTIKVTQAQGKVTTEFGANVGTMDINDFDAMAQRYIAKFSKINPGVLPLFVTYDAYLTSGGDCCIGGYHSATDASQTYVYSTYIDVPGAFSQDVSGFSHELGEWMDNAFANNNTPCGSLDVGVGSDGEANYGDFPYVLNGSTYNLQDLAFMSYFGAPRSRSLHGWFSFQDNQSLGVCSNAP